ncbi:MAG: guanylate kinase [Planctomycetia bacterium]|nr:guanylate kinase [Planctomycetia bacterium]
MSHPGKLIVISGPSGSGKTTIADRLMELEKDRLTMSVSATTRAPREGELNGLSYHFLSREEFRRKLHAGEFLEACEVYPGIWYGTLRSEVAPSLEAGKWVVLEIDVRGAETVLKHYPDAVTIFVRPRSMEELERRLRGRKTEGESAIKGRLDTARRELEKANSYQYQVINDTDRVDGAVEAIRKILNELEGKC